MQTNSTTKPTDREVAQAIMDCSKQTKEDPKRILEQVANGTLIVIRWQEDQFTLVFNSPNGL